MRWDCFWFAFTFRRFLHTLFRSICTFANLSQIAGESIKFLLIFTRFCDGKTGRDRLRIYDCQSGIVTCWAEDDPSQIKNFRFLTIFAAFSPKKNLATKFLSFLILFGHFQMRFTQKNNTSKTKQMKNVKMWNLRAILWENFRQNSQILFTRA